jgi:hypothetical protein
MPAKMFSIFLVALALACLPEVGRSADEKFPTRPRLVDGTENVLRASVKEPTWIVLNLQYRSREMHRRHPERRLCGWSP